MTDYKNPFEYEAANNLSSEKVVSYFIDDFNYSRFLNSTRNVVVVGDRGCGKTMALIYNSLKAQSLVDSPDALQRIGVYVPCKTVLTQKKEHELVKESQYAAVLSEHFLTLAVLFHLVDSLQAIPDIAADADESALRDEAGFVLGFTLPTNPPFLEALRQSISRESHEIQRKMNSPEPEQVYAETRSFGTSFLPLLDILRKIPRLRDAHFMLMLDDVHDLNDYQVRAVNSWIAYRDHSLFSVKIASARVGQPHFKTATGGAILEGHDFVFIDLEQPYHNEESNFGQLAKKLIQRRLDDSGIQVTPESFFPVNQSFEQELDACRERVRAQANEKFPNGPEKSVTDYVYRFARAEWFRTRPDHRNLPAYSGFQTLVYLSTGVIRNLLEPCYWMYDDAKSRASDGEAIETIEPQLQRDKIIDRSKRAWERLGNLDRCVEGCSQADAKKIFNLFDQLAILFRKRLESHKSEPRAISFTISGLDSAVEEELLPLLQIARAAQLLYARSGPAKERGKRETYYVPNRMLLAGQGTRSARSARSCVNKGYRPYFCNGRETDTVRLVRNKERIGRLNDRSSAGVFQ